MHLLALVAHGIFRNGVCNDQVLQVCYSNSPFVSISVCKRLYLFHDITCNLWVGYESQIFSQEGHHAGA